MNAGRLSPQNASSAGFGWPLIATPMRLSAWPLVRGIRPRRRNYGHHSRRSIANVRSCTPISWPPMPSFCPANAIVQETKKPAERRIVSALTIRCGNESVALSAKRSPSRKRLRIIVGRFGPLFITLMPRGYVSTAMPLRLHDHPKWNSVR